MDRTAADLGINVLESMPTSPREIAEWFGSMPAARFDSVCCSAIVFAMTEIQAESGFVSARDVAPMVVAMRNRYRRMVEEHRMAGPYGRAGERHHKSVVNEMQARIIRRVAPGAKRYKNSDLADLMRPAAPKITKKVVQDIRLGNTWKHLERRAA